MSVTARIWVRRHSRGGQFDGMAALAARKIQDAPWGAKLQETLEMIDLHRRSLQ